MGELTFTPVSAPGVRVNQFIIDTTGTTPSESDLGGLIIGPKYNVISDKLAGEYLGEETQFFFPDAEAGQKVKKDSVKIVLKDIVLDIVKSDKTLVLDKSSSTSGNLSGSTLTDLTGDFITNAVEVNDSISITYTLSGINYTIKAIVTNVAATVLTLDKPLPTVSNTNYVIERSKGYISSFGSVLKTTVVNGFANVYPGDKVNLVHPTQGAISAIVLNVIDSDEIKINKSLNTSTNISYEIERSNVNRLQVIGLTSGSFVVNGDVLQDNSGVGFVSVNIGDSVRILRGQEIDTASVIAKLDTYRIQLSKSFNSGNIIYSVTRTQAINNPIQLTDDLNDFVIMDSNDDNFVDNTYFTILSSLNVSDLDGSITIKSAKVFVDYIALSVADANTILSIEDDSQIVSKCGVISHLNPLGLAASIAASNTLNTLRVIPVEDETNEAWLKALTVAEKADIHNVCLLSQSLTIQSYARSHVDGMSTAARHGWRVLWMNLKHTFEKIIKFTTENGKLEYIPDVNGDYIRFYDGLADFSDTPANNIMIAFWENGELFDSNDKPIDPTYFKVTAKGDDDTILICDTSAYIGEAGRGLYVPIKAESTSAIIGTYDVLKKTLTANTNTAFPNINSVVINVSDRVVLNDQPDAKQNGTYILTIKGDANTPWVLTKDSSLSAVDAIDIIGAPTSGSPKVGSYQIIKILSKTEQAQAMANVAHSFSSRRIIYNSNESCIVEIDQVDRVVPGYNISAGYAGIASATGVRPHMPFNFFPINGIKGVLFTIADDYFTDTEVGIMTAGGCWVVDQPVFNNSAPYAWKQTTTDTTSIKTTEFSFTRNLDDICKKIYKDHLSQAGKSNNVAAAWGLISGQTTVTLSALTEGSYDSPIGGKLGPQVTSISASGPEVDPLDPTGTVTNIDAVLPLPLNNMTFNVRAQ